MLLPLVDLLLISQVTGKLLDNLTSWDALRAALPVGTVSGAPKVPLILCSFCLLLSGHDTLLSFEVNNVRVWLDV